MQAGGALSKAEFVFPFCARVRLDELGKLGFGNAASLRERFAGAFFAAAAFLAAMVDFSWFLVGKSVICAGLRKEYANIYNAMRKAGMPTISVFYGI